MQCINQNQMLRFSRSLVRICQMADFFFFFFFGRDSSLARSIVNIQIFTHFKIFFFPFNDALAEWAKNYTLLWFVKLFDDLYFVVGKKYPLIKNFQFLRPISKPKSFTYHEHQLQCPVIFLLMINLEKTIF